MVGGAEILRYAAFSSGGQGGNPAGIVLDARDLSAPEMAGIAAEVGYSETAFLTSRGGSVREYLTRYYSPGGEIAFCGHATIACGIALAERYGQGRFTFDTRVGRVQAMAGITKSGEWHASLSGAGSHSRPASGAELDEVLGAIGWNRGDLDPRYPVHVLQPGNNHFLVPVREHETLKSLDYDYAALSAVMKLRGWTTIHAVWAESPTVFRAPSAWLRCLRRSSATRERRWDARAESSPSSLPADRHGCTARATKSPTSATEARRAARPGRRPGTPAARPPTPDRRERHDCLVPRGTPATGRMPMNHVPVLDTAPGASEGWDVSTPDETGFSGTRLGRIDVALTREVTSGRMPGAVLGILRDGKLAYLRAVGWRDPAARIPMTPDSLFWIASMTKPIVAVAALTLVEQGQLLLGDPVSAHLPEFTDMRVAGPDGQSRPGLVPARREPAIHDLMTHTAGVIEGLLGNSPVHARYAAAVGDGMTSYTAEEFRARLAGLPLFNHPGETWHYGWGFDLLGQIIERITQSSLGDYLARAVTGPLGMTGTGFARHGIDTARWAHPLPPGDERPALPDLSKARFDSGGAGLAGTAGDYLKFVSFLLERRRGRGTAILAPATVTAMTTDRLDPHADVSRLTTLHERGHGFGLGVAVRQSAGAPSPGSPGDFCWPGAAGTYWWADPRHQLGVVLMTHTPGRQAGKRLHELVRTLVYQALIPDQHDDPQHA